MAVVQRVVKPTTRKGKKVLLAREPQVIEGPKRTLLFQGRKCSERIKNILRDLYNLKKPNAHQFTRKHDITIFENVTPVENFCRKHECSLFIMGSHNKKRPDNIVMGRMFDYSLLDMVELGVDSYKGLKEFSETITLGLKPCIVFSGTGWDQTPETKSLMSILVDLFHREKVNNVRLQGLEHVITFILTPEGKVLFRSYKVHLKKSGLIIPKIMLEAMGPEIDFTVRRSKLASEDLMKQAVRKPKVLKVTKKKNISVDGLGTKHGRIHVGKQDINKLQTRKMKGLRKTPAEKKAERQKRKSAEAVTDNAAKKIKVQQ